MIPKTYRDNRARFTFAELRPYEGQWVAFSRDGSEVVGSAPTLAGLDARLLAAGIDPQTVAFEKIEFEDVSLGGTELMCC